MKKILVFITCFMIVGIVGCGTAEQIYDRQNYESITNERGDMVVVSGGDTLATYLDCKVIYADANSQAIWIKTLEGKEIYIQGDVIFTMK